MDKLGHRDQAEDLGRRMVARYPDSAALRADLAGLYWRHGKPAEAARLLKDASRRLRAEDWRSEVAPEFEEAFESRPNEALAAFMALLAEGCDPFAIKYLIYSSARLKMYAVAFEMASRIRWQGQGAVEFNVIAYQNLLEVKGQPAALAWLRSRIPPDSLNRASMVIFEVGRHELLWDLIERPDGNMADFVWLMRASAAVRVGVGNDPNRARLFEYYNRSLPGHYHVIGRFLLGLATEREVLDQATDASRRCEIAYFIGVRAQADGRYEDASDWYRVAVETGQSRYVEYRWAFYTLYKWLDPYKSLSRLAAERL